METNAEGQVVTFDDLTALDDSALLDWRARARAELERLPPASTAHIALTALYDLSTLDVTDRARKAWSTQQPPTDPKLPSPTPQAPARHQLGEQVRLAQTPSSTR